MAGEGEGQLPRPRAQRSSVAFITLVPWGSSAGIQVGWAHAPQSRVLGVPQDSLKLGPRQEGPLPWTPHSRRSHSVPPLTSCPPKAHAPPPNAGPQNSPTHSLHEPSPPPPPCSWHAHPGPKGRPRAAIASSVDKTWLEGLGMGSPHAATFQQPEPRSPGILNAPWPSRWFSRNVHPRGRLACVLFLSLLA